MYVYLPVSSFFLRIVRRNSERNVDLAPSLNPSSPGGGSSNAIPLLRSLESSSSEDSPSNCSLNGETESNLEDGARSNDIGESVVADDIENAVCESGDIAETDQERDIEEDARSEDIGEAVVADDIENAICESVEFGRNLQKLLESGLDASI